MDFGLHVKVLATGAAEAILHWSGKIQLTKSLLIQSVCLDHAVMLESLILSSLEQLV